MNLTLWEKANAYTPFYSRHIGPNAAEQKKMLDLLGYPSLDSLVETAVPSSIIDRSSLELKEPVDEHVALAELSAIMDQNQLFRSYIGMGFYDCVTPPVILRNILENPGWYTQYTPYQSEIAQGRLEALLNFQTMVSDLTGLAIANASMLDEATAAAEAMSMCLAMKSKTSSNIFLIANDCHSQTIEVVRTRAEPLGIQVVVAEASRFDFSLQPFGVLLQYPGQDGRLFDPSAVIAKAHGAGALVTVAADILALSILKSPGELGADVAVGSTQRFGLVLGYGGPHAAYMATKEEYKRRIPGRIVGLSKDADGKNAYRLALATREQHIRREKATSNICTSQVLTAIVSSMYAVYHGPDGIRKIAERVHALTSMLASGVTKLGLTLVHNALFDTIKIAGGKEAAAAIRSRAENSRTNLRYFADGSIGVSLNEVTTPADVEALLLILSGTPGLRFSMEELASGASELVPANLRRQSPYLQHAIFNSYHNETDMMRYIKKLEARDLSLTRAMIPLGSCTMKLNAASELFPIFWPKVAKLHPYVPLNQAKGYAVMIKELSAWLSNITGFDAVSLQPNSGAQGEYAGLLVIRAYHLSRGEPGRSVCLIPTSAHGTNPASAVMAGMQIVPVACDSDGNIDKEDLLKKASAHKEKLAAMMVTYPSTHGVFEEGIRELCEVIHQYGGQVYMDGANLQAQISLCKAGKFGPDVCHLNLHKTFAIPHGGGGPGIGPIAVKSHLAPFLPGHPEVKVGGETAIGPITSAPWGSAGALAISWMYIRMMGEEGLALATKVAILNANYIARRLHSYYPTLYRGNKGLVAHECIIDLREIKKRSGIDESDVAKRLMDYSFHAPTVSWPVVGTMMIEPTESEPFSEIERFCAAMIAIRGEIREVEEGRADKVNNLLKNAPHSVNCINEAWDRPYSMKAAVFPTKETQQNKFWPYVSRLDNALGDRHLVCCLPGWES